MQKMGTLISIFESRWGQTEPLGRHGQGTINTSPADPQSPCDLGRSNAFATQTLDLGCLGSCSRSSSFVLSFRLGLGNALALPLKHELALKLGNCPKHVEHQPAGAIFAGASIMRLIANAPLMNKSSSSRSEL